MDFRDVLSRRRMIRRYTAEPVDPDALARIIDAGLRGPSAGFAQGVEFVVVTSEETRHALASAANEAEYVERGLEPWLSAAPVHLVVSVDPEAYRHRYGEPDKGASLNPDHWTTPYWTVDAGAALMLVLLATTNEGLAAGFLGSHAFDDLAGVVGLPTGYETIGLVTIGHGAEAPPIGSALRKRRPLDETVHTERWKPPQRMESDG